ncbi:hypothetical protein ABIB40_002887 [Pedobacter sp. UYP30]
MLINELKFPIDYFEKNKRKYERRFSTQTHHMRITYLFSLISIFSMSVLKKGKKDSVTNTTSPKIIGT